MQQKSKFIIHIILICFISFLFFPTRVWGVGDSSGASGGGSECVQTCQSYTCSGCPDISYTGPGAFYCPAYWDGSDCCSYSCKKCDKWKPETIPSWCSEDGTTDTTRKPKDKWCCNNSTGSCYECSKTGAWSTQAKCEACCPTGTYLHCRPPLTTFWGADANKLYCKSKTWCETDPGDECKKDADCGNGGTTDTTDTTDTTNTTSPSTGYSGYKCKNTECDIDSEYCKKCQYSSSWSTDSGLYNNKATCDHYCTLKYRCQCNENNLCVCSECPSTGPCEKECKINSDCQGTTDTTLPPSECEIYEFSINGKTNIERDPLLVWVNASLRGLISTNTDCTKCTVESTDTWGNPNPVEYAINIANNYKAKETFTIPESGTYFFTATCQGTDPDDVVVDTVSLKTVQAINLPWWREIIPVLPGFLRGIFR